jgi:hypothetical protein
MEPLTAAEDDELRRLAALAQFGELTPMAAALFAELRSRDRRTTIRPPRQLAVPFQRGPIDDCADLLV